MSTVEELARKNDELSCQLQECQHARAIMLSNLRSAEEQLTNAQAVLGRQKAEWEESQRQLNRSTAEIVLLNNALTNLRSQEAHATRNLNYLDRHWWVRLGCTLGIV